MLDQSLTMRVVYYINRNFILKQNIQQGINFLSVWNKPRGLIRCRKLSFVPTTGDLCVMPPPSKANFIKIELITDLDWRLPENLVFTLCCCPIL